MRYGTSALKYFHPATYHCYYASKETYTAIELYSALTSEDHITNNLIYRTGPIFTELRILYNITVNQTEPFKEDRDAYVASRSVGRIVNYVLAPTITP